MQHIYLDWAATALPDTTVLNAAHSLSLENFANPSSAHGPGKEAAALMDSHRNRTAALLGIGIGQLVYTSGGTESNNMVISSLLGKKRKGNIVLTGIEHPSVYEPAACLERSGWETRIVNPEPSGRVSAEDIASKTDDDTALVLMMAVNNETGAIQPVEETGKLLHEKHGSGRLHFHVDAVQAVGKIPFIPGRLPVDSVSVSSHKFRGPRGFGMLCLKRVPEMIYRGGGQEGGVRHGTENLYGIIGSTMAAEEAVGQLEMNMDHALLLKKRLIERISEIKGSVFLPGVPAEELVDPALYSPWILSASFKPIPGEVLVRVMSAAGFCISTGSACHSARKKRSRVMDAMGIDPSDSFSAIRISTGAATTSAEIDKFCDVLAGEASKLSGSLRRTQQQFQ